MNFSEYTLVSFGDSFTFGQDTVPAPFINHTASINSVTAKEVDNNRLWKLECNENSYTQFLADNLGFKDSINFGVLGGSNERAISLLETFLRSNPTLKVFILFNFTSSSRFMLFPQLNENHTYFSLNENPLVHYDCIDIRPFSDDDNDISDGRYSGINTKSINQQYTYWRNSIQDVYNHIKDRRTVYYMLSSYNVPHATFDGINDMDYRILRDNPTQYIRSDGGNFTEYMYNDDERYIFKEMDFLKSYYKELVDESPLLTHIPMNSSEFPDIRSGDGSLTEYRDRNINGYISRLGRSYNGDETHYLSEHGGKHWNTEGHIEVAILIYNFINDKYDT